MQLEMDTLRAAMHIYRNRNQLDGTPNVMKRERKPMNPLGDVAPPPVDQSAGEQAAVPQSRPFSTRDYVYECVQRVSLEDPLLTPLGHEMNAGERELTLIPTVASIEQELETLRVEGAGGDAAAVQALHRIAHESTKHLTLLSQSVPGLVSQIAEQESVWPVLYSRLGFHKNSADELITTIKLGAKLAGALEPENALSEDTVARRVLFIVARAIERIRAEAKTQEERKETLAEVESFMASVKLVVPPGTLEKARFEDLKAAALTPDDAAQLGLLLEVEVPLNNQDLLRNLVRGSLRLPDLSAESEVLDAWMAVVKQLLMDVCGGHPEKSKLRTMGTFQAAANKELYPEGTPSYESNVRTGIFRRLKTTLERIAEGAKQGPA